MSVQNTIIGPVLTEKATDMAARGVYTFSVMPLVTKHSIARSLEDMYDVEVAKVRVLTKKGRSKRIGKTRREVSTADQKIAYIWLKKGTLELFPKA